MCSIWQKKSVGEMTPAEAARFLRRWPQFSWIQLTGGELFMRRDIEELVAAILENDRSLYLLSFPTTGWFGDRAVALVERILGHGIGRLMTTISIDGPEALHDSMRGLPGSWARAIETLRRLRAVRARNFQVVVGMTLFAKNAPFVDETIAAIRRHLPDFERTSLHLNIGHESGHYFANRGYLSDARTGPVVDAIRAHRAAVGHSLHPVRFLEDRYQAGVERYYASGRSALPCSAFGSSCFIDPYWNLFPCSIWNEPAGNLRDADFDLAALWGSERRRQLREGIVDEQCPHCWTPCEAHPAILGNLVRAISLRPPPAGAPAAGDAVERVRRVS
jgi:MoaA/NifB/PqqE/SkfB family radical SAM enzyme